MYILCAIWYFVGSYCLQTRLDGRSTKIAIIVNISAPNSVKQLRTVLGHTRYYRKFIKGYAKITTPIEKLLKKDVKFLWNEECQKSLDTLKEKMVTTPILVFPDWTKPFHVHVDASSM